ncbi:hypothetical protein ERO13_A04G029804v2 [Gossypium hirsutum]|uniref:RING-type domain-containing protein n=1 Tax=Gossypium mustelinum TaxID=34275 RepID=A0A5D2ZN70_GOSMU|nr:hypothetical protein ERO13_A04G029804v2 [Gossypium hirsutum]TYJ39021.1 hypothetical protein E1A91_A04G036600v1 [Gossypium mustelinum]
MIKLSFAIQYSLDYRLILSSLTALGIALLLLCCLIAACILISLFVTIFVYLRLLTSESRIRNYLQFPVTMQRLPDIVDDRVVLSVQVLEKLLPSLKIYEDNKHQLKYSDCPICLDDYIVGESFTVFPVCKHTFHSSCIQHWLQNNLTCPVCRQCIYDL